MKFRNWFKFSWFTSKDRENLKKSTESIERVEKKVDSIVAEVNKTPYKNLIYSNGNLTVVFSDGTVLDKMSVDREFFTKIKDAPTKEDIVSLMVDNSIPTPPVENHTFETEEERAIISDNLDILRDNDHFIIEGNQVTLKGVNLPIPAIVLASFIEILERTEIIRQEIDLGKGNIDYLTIEEEDLFRQYHALKMFWLKLALNPLSQSREDLLVFCRKNDVRITNNGNLILYRRIVSLSGADKSYVAFVSQTYYSLKKKGQDTRNYAIGLKKNQKGAFYFTDLREEGFVADELIGNLQHMYLELPDYENNVFTAAHDNTMKIKIGAIYSIPNEKINLDNGLCAAGGLHAAAVDYNYSGFGDTPVVVLVNPSRAITVPKNEIGKLRTTEMFIACINDKAQGVHFDDDALSSFDEEYHDLTLAQLELAASGNNFGTLAVKEFLPSITLTDLKAIQEMLSVRIKSII